MKLILDLPKNIAEDSARYRQDGRPLRERVHFFDTNGVKMTDLNEGTIAVLTSQCSHPGEWVIPASRMGISRPLYDPSEPRFLVSDLFVTIDRTQEQWHVVETQYALQHDPEGAVSDREVIDSRYGVDEEGVLLTWNGAKWIVPFDGNSVGLPHAGFGAPTPIGVIERSARRHLFDSYRLGDGEKEEDADFQRLLAMEPIWARCFTVMNGRNFRTALREAYPVEFPGVLPKSELVELAVAAIKSSRWKSVVFPTRAA